jgi:hypothetical protein
MWRESKELNDDNKESKCFIAFIIPCLSTNTDLAHYYNTSCTILFTHEMGKNKKPKNSNESPTKSSLSPTPDDEHRAPTITLRQWLAQDRRAYVWVGGCILTGLLFGFLVGTGWLEFSAKVKPWRQELANRLRSTTSFRLLSFETDAWDEVQYRIGYWVARMQRDMEVELYASNPAHPRVFAVLREAIVREPGGFVHPDLGFLVPAPCGAARGIGMVRNGWHECQKQCLPGRAEEKERVKNERWLYNENNVSYPLPTEPNFKQEEILIRVPLNYQMTRTKALEVLLPLIPAEVQVKAGMSELDDAIILVLFLAHERGVGRYSRWMPYIASLPPEPSCGYSRNLRPYMLDALAVLREELGVPTEGWSEELSRATAYAETIVEALTKDYGPYIQTPADKSVADNIAWALCQVASRATAGSEKHGTLRLIPMVDQINHDESAAGFIELTGRERIKNGHFIDATEDDSGTFVVRSFRHGRRKALKVGQELLANYNVPHYSPLDWFVSLGFVPPEKQTPWEMIEPVLPRIKKVRPRYDESHPAEVEMIQENVPSVTQELHTEL